MSPATSLSAAFECVDPLLLSMVTQPVRSDRVSAALMTMT